MIAIRFGVLCGCGERHERRCEQTHLKLSGDDASSAARQHCCHLGVSTKPSQRRLVVEACVRGGALGWAAAMIDLPGPPQRSRWGTVG
jgi:hypothetical protein